MAQMTPFSCVISVVRPLMKGTRNLGEFTAGLIDMGMKASQGPKGEQTALQLRSAASWKGYANGSSPLPADLASEIASRWDEVAFGVNVIGNYGETALISLAENLYDFDTSINKGNCAEGLGKLLYNTFLQISGVHTAKPSEEVRVVRRIEQSGQPYFDTKTNRIRFGEYSNAAAARREIPDEVQDEELAYIAPLLEAYCEQQYKNGVPVTVADIPNRLASHFQDQRKAFYSAEWLRETSWNCFHDGQEVFEIWLDNMYAGVSDTQLRAHSSAVERLLATLEQATQVQLDRIPLAQIVDLIDVWVRKGSCHELAAQKKLRWAD
ncbi:ABC-three component system protein [Rothia sp. 32237D007AR]